MGAAGETAPAGPAGVASSTPRVSQVRTNRVIERESKMMVDETKRVAWVSAICFGMLAVLVVIDRLQ
ncbi:MAG: hypothetical protein DWG83_00400 [Chloroflexi bacterium]|nr:hypothetical protein [Chloroflexota bacterium]